MTSKLLSHIALLVLVLLQTSGCQSEDEVPAAVEAPVESTAVAQEAQGGGMANLARNIDTGADAQSGAGEGRPEDTKPSRSNTATLPVVGRRWTGDLDELVERRTIRLLTVHSPGRFYLEEGRGRGIVAEMATRYEEFVNDHLERGHIKVYVVVIPVARDELIPRLLEGRGDLISAGLTITDERREMIDFSIPVSKPLNEILVTGPSAPEVATLDDLAGEILYLREDSSYRESVEMLNAGFVERGLEPIIIKALPGALEDDDLIEMVNAGLIPWAVVDDYKPVLWKDVFENLRVRDDLVFRKGGRIAWAMRPDSPLLKASVDAFLKENREGTLIGNILRNRYIRDFDWAANALSAEDYARFNDLAGIFRRHGEAYGIEYLLAAAQGYQESRLDQDVRSAAGAVGVMQLLPATAADSNVGIPDIENVDSNIEAGIKYMHFLRERYFSSPDISPLNQVLLALGAYNAGPARMISMRRKAEEQGYDPNVWFDNVELVAAQEIGRETVQYVSNIFRYYLTYRMIINEEIRHAEARRQMGMSDAPDL